MVAIKKFFPACMGISSYSYIKKLIDRHTVISFDLFDTLLKRNVWCPQNIFMLVEREGARRFGSQLDGFSEKRISAERKAREISVCEDVTINEIYEQLPYEDGMKSILLQLELDAEYAMITPNEEMKRVYEYAVSSGKKILFVSDMYLSVEFIERLLQKCGYRHYTKLYVSSDTKVSKSTGHMYKLILNENTCKADDFLHIGDNIWADYLRPCFLGIRAILIRRHVNHLLYTKTRAVRGVDSGLLYGFINNSISGKRLFRIGYETLGPLLYGFCVWLHSQKKYLGLEQLLFFSRDGQIMHKAYKALYPDDPTVYVRISRRSAIVPFIHFYDGDFQKIMDRLPLARYLDLPSLFEALGLDCTDYTDVIERHKLNTEAVFTKGQILEDNRLRSLLAELEADIRENSRNEYMAFKQYVQGLGLKRKVGVVDIGWTGRMQSALEKLLSSIYGDSIETYGFYFGISTIKKNMFGYLFNRPDANVRVLMTGYVGLFETLFSADHGSVKRYRTGLPIELYDFEYDQNEDLRDTYAEIREFQSGALSFVERFSEDSSSRYIEWSSNLSFRSMNALGTNPRYKDLIRMGNWFFLNSNRLYRLAYPTKRSFCNVVSAKKELYMSYWKIGYLKRLFRIPFPYVNIYRLLNRLSH